MSPYDFKRVDISLVDVPANRLRGKKPARIETLAKDIAINGQLQPIIVIEEANGRFTLIKGLQRLEAIRSNKRDEIDARVTPAAWTDGPLRRLQEIMATLNRENFTALERCEALTELKRVYETLYPQTKNGANGGRGGKKNENEIFAFSKMAAEATGLSRRSIELAVSIFSGLAIAATIRLRGTWVERKQAELKALSEAKPEIQNKALDLLLCNPPEAGSVADAIVLAEGRKLADPTERAFRTVLDKWKRFPIGQKRSFVTTNRAEILRILDEEGAL